MLDASSHACSSLQETCALCQHRGVRAAPIGTQMYASPRDDFILQLVIGMLTHLIRGALAAVNSSRTLLSCARHWLFH